MKKIILLIAFIGIIIIPSNAQTEKKVDHIDSKNSVDLHFDVTFFHLRLGASYERKLTKSISVKAGIFSSYSDQVSSDSWIFGNRIVIRGTGIEVGPVFYLTKDESRNKFYLEPSIYFEKGKRYENNSATDYDNLFCTLNVGYKIRLSPKIYANIYGDILKDVSSKLTIPRLGVGLSFAL